MKTDNFINVFALGIGIVLLTWRDTQVITLENISQSFWISEENTSVELKKLFVMQVQLLFGNESLKESFWL